MEPLEVLNRGFGGAQISHVIYHFEEIIKPYEPKAIVFFCGTVIVVQSSLILEIQID